MPPQKTGSTAWIYIPRTMSFDPGQTCGMSRAIRAQMRFIFGLRINSYLGEETPPGPVAQLEVGQAVALDDANSTQLLYALLVVSAKKRARHLAD